MHRRIHRSTTPPHVTKAQALARAAADHYFTAVASGFALDTTIKDPSLIEALVAIETTLITDETRSLDGYQEQAAMHAGFLLGVEFGRRIGGAR